MTDMPAPHGAADNAIVAFFAWWNIAMADPALLTEQGFADFYTADAQLVVNGHLRATGCRQLASHYRGVAERCEDVAMVLPVQQAFHTVTRAFVHCRTRVVVSGRQAAEEAMAYAVLAADGRMARLQVVSLSV
jgi:hypothetical protein